MVSALSSARPRLASQLPVKRSGLGDAAGEAVQQEPVGAVGLGQPLQHHRDDDVVGDQLAGVQVGLGHLAQRGAVGHIGPQDVAGGHVHQLEPVSDPVRLGSLARPRRTQQHNPHHLPNPRRCAAASSSMLSGSRRPAPRGALA